MQGFIKDWRQEIDSNVWLMPPLYHRVWQWIKYNVNHEPANVPFRDGSVHRVEAGCKITSIRQIAEGVGWYERGLRKQPNPKTIKSILDWLEKEQMIAVEGNSRYTLLKVLNWGVYQSKGSSESNSRETVGKQSLDTNKNDKNEKNEKKLYMEFVYLTTEEHAKLVEQLGERVAHDYIVRLNDYIGSKGKKYKSHYYTILNWHRKNEPKPSEKPNINLSKISY